MEGWIKFIDALLLCSTTTRGSWSRWNRYRTSGKLTSGRTLNKTMPDTRKRFAPTNCGPRSRRRWKSDVADKRNDLGIGRDCGFTLGRYHPRCAVGFRHLWSPGGNGIRHEFSGVQILAQG